MYVLDTDVLIDIQRGHAPALAWFASLTEFFRSRHRGDGTNTGRAERTTGAEGFETGRTSAHRLVIRSRM